MSCPRPAAVWIAPPPGTCCPAPRTPAPRFLTQLRHLLRVRRYALRTEECQVDWARRFLLFHGQRHPGDLGTLHVEEFLTPLAVQGNVSVSTPMQALNAQVFLYKQALQINLGTLNHVRAKRPARLPVVASPEEVKQVLDAIEGGGGMFRRVGRLGPPFEQVIVSADEFVTVCMPFSVIVQSILAPACRVAPSGSRGRGCPSMEPRLARFGVEQFCYTWRFFSYRAKRGILAR